MTVWATYHCVVGNILPASYRLRGSDLGKGLYYY